MKMLNGGEKGCNFWEVFTIETNYAEYEVMIEIRGHFEIKVGIAKGSACKVRNDKYKNSLN